MIFWFRWTQWQHRQWIFILCRLGTRILQTPIIVSVSVGPRLETREVGGNGCNHVSYFEEKLGGSAIQMYI